MLHVVMYRYIQKNRYMMYQVDVICHFHFIILKTSVYD